MQTITLTFNETTYSFLPQSDLGHRVLINDVKTPYYLEYSKTSDSFGFYNVRNLYNQDEIVGSSIYHSELTISAVVEVINNINSDLTKL